MAIETKCHGPDLRIGLDSDFIDYYDHHFSAHGLADTIFRRRSTNSMSRQEAFRILGHAGYPVPLHGLVRNLPFVKDALVVVYFDEFAHRGDGKQLVPLAVAKVEYPDCFASMFMGELGPSSQSIRILNIGDKAWILSYVSDHPWASNCGNVSVKLNHSGGVHRFKRLDFPLYAVDCVARPTRRYAGGRYRETIRYFFVDLNLSPQVGGTGVELVLEPEAAASLICNWIKQHGLPKF